METAVQPSLWRRALATLAIAFDPAREDAQESVFQTREAATRALGRDEEIAAPKRRDAEERE